MRAVIKTSRPKKHTGSLQILSVMLICKRFAETTVNRESSIYGRRFILFIKEGFALFTKGGVADDGSNCLHNNRFVYSCCPLHFGKKITALFTHGGYF